MNPEGDRWLRKQGIGQRAALHGLGRAGGCLRGPQPGAHTLFRLREAGALGEGGRQAD